MPANERFLGRARRLGRDAVKRIGQEIHDARVAHGLSQEATARRAGISRSKLGRIERGEYVHAPLLELVVLAAVVGLELAARTFPVGSPFRDAVHAALLERFRRLISTTLRWATEVPLPTAGDLRAWDAMARGVGFRIGIEAETRARDGQALERRIRAKQRDSGVDVVILVLSDTRSNRQFLRERSASFDELFPIPSADALSALAAGTCPSGNSVILA